MSLVLNVIFSNSRYGVEDRYAHLYVSLFQAREDGGLDSLYEFEHKAARFAASAQGSRMDRGLTWYAHRLGFRPERDGVTTLVEARAGLKNLAAIERKVEALYVPGDDSIGSWVCRMARALKVAEIRVLDSDTREERRGAVEGMTETVAAFALRALERCQ